MIVVNKITATLVILFVFGARCSGCTETIFNVDLRGFDKPEQDERIVNAVVWCLDNEVQTDCDVRHIGYTEETRAMFFAFGPNCTGDMLAALATAIHLIDLRRCFDDFKRTTKDM